MPALTLSDPRRPLARLPLQPDTLLALLCLYWALSANRAFLAGARAAMQASALQMLGLVLLLALLHFVLLRPLMPGRLAKPVLLLVALIAAVASHFTQALGTVLDPAMLRNALHTDWPEARELLTHSLALHVALQLLPAWALIASVQLKKPGPGWRARLLPLARWLLACLLLLAGLALMFQPLASLMRNHKPLRYQLLPVAALWSLPRSLLSDAQARPLFREPIGLDARPGPSWTGSKKPRLLVLVLGETVRAANWGTRQLPNGERRDTTPLLHAEPGLLHWPKVQSCGTDTETAVPCLFAPIGRQQYDEGRIRRQQSLLHVLARAGVQVEWLDNQSGCKGVCDGLPTTQLQCAGGRCLDDALLAALPERLHRAEQLGGVHLLVLHMLGNHGPAYHRRVPEGFAPYQPACAQDDLGRCERAAIVNAFDNAIRHTDALLTALWQQLRAAEPQLDTAMLYLSDHGESLGEHGLYLHGMPYALAPAEQTEVPMLLGLSPGWTQARGWTPACLAAMTRHPAPRQDHLFHTVLSLLDVRTALHDPAWDLLAACR